MLPNFDSLLHHFRDRDVNDLFNDALLDSLLRHQLNDLQDFFHNPGHRHINDLDEGIRLASIFSGSVWTSYVAWSRSGRALWSWVGDVFRYHARIPVWTGSVTVQCVRATHGLPTVWALVYRGCPCWDPPVCPPMPRQDGIGDKAPTRCCACACVASSWHAHSTLWNCAVVNIIADGYEMSTPIRQH